MATTVRRDGVATCIAKKTIAKVARRHVLPLLTIRAAATKLGPWRSWQVVILLRETGASPTEPGPWQIWLITAI